MTTEERHRPEVLRRYEGTGIIVHWEPKLCIHAGICLRDLPSVFDNAARPWVAVDGATADEIAEAIEGCPTGALYYERTDGAPQEQPDQPTHIQPRTNGPLFVRGEVEVVDMQGNATRVATRAALCRCGQSANKPYCDLTHRAIGFRSE
jgi:uncharacterized Fe-S cluster protein YjdI